ncbi:MULTISPECIES: hypothetical protein [Bacillus cereus group]|uniref:hypothetical protein n=1 Tax=Bacillus cereus group TaxID=86661 RepID=UPI000A377B6D|nr:MULTISPECIES: hypothetical protein [Bacillus cereus group]MBJ7967687.1 hypothetical protein [Bacillus cereus]MBJ8004069.1 hypothetical protein [Bacillus cereus]MCC2327550.1 prokaryotic E2 ligase family D protein [Bacillus wiedmannii]MDG0891780.1 hypothetical protein [Bacillus paranthracis]MDG0931453.1 hypothetical protein [Bacillus paranthracis]
MKTVAIFDALEPKGIVTIQQSNDGLSRGETVVTFKDFYEALKEVMEQETQDNTYLSSGILPKGCVKHEVLSQKGDKQSVWIEIPKAQWDIQFFERPFQQVGFPRLLFRYTVYQNKVTNISIFALKEDTALEEGMKLYRFPYSNVNANGSVCTGRVMIPEIRTLKDLETFHVLFFASSFNHDLTYTHTEPVGELFKRFENQSFDDSILIESNMTF